MTGAARWTKVEAEIRDIPDNLIREARVLSAPYMLAIHHGSVEVIFEQQILQAREGDIIWVPSGAKWGFHKSKSLELMTLRLRHQTWAVHAEGDQEAMELVYRLNDVALSGRPKLPLTDDTKATLLPRLAKMAKFHLQQIDKPYYRCALKAGGHADLSALSVLISV